MDMRELKELEIAARYKLAFRRGAWHALSQSGNGILPLKRNGPA
jgi:hypothetical protein